MNAQNKNQVIVAAVLVVVLVVVVFYQFVIKGVGPKPRANTPKAPATKTANTGTAAGTSGVADLKKADVDIDTLLRSIEVVTFDYNTERIDRNPMTPLVGRVSRVQSLPLLSSRNANVVEIMQKNVSAIIYDEYNPAAIVDNEVVGVGFVYPTGVSIAAIEPTRVIFRLGDSLIPVELKEL